MDFWRKCLSVSLQRENSRIILRKVKSVLPSISVSPVPLLSWSSRSVLQLGVILSYVYSIPVLLFLCLVFV